MVTRPQQWCAADFLRRRFRVSQRRAAWTVGYCRATVWSRAKARDGEACRGDPHVGAVSPVVPVSKNSRAVECVGLGGESQQMRRLSAALRLKRGGFGGNRGTGVRI